MIYIVLGWAIPATAALAFYLVFLPGVALAVAGQQECLRPQQHRNPGCAPAAGAIRPIAKRASGC